MLTTRYKDVVNRFYQPLAMPLARGHVSPGLITLLGPILTSLVCLWLMRTGNVVQFVVAMVAVGALDGLDGAVARASGRVTKFGAYLDAICDRYVEIIVVCSVAHITGYWLLSMIALAGALLVSYAKARAAMEVPVSNQEWPDLMERAERSTLYGVGLIAGAVISWQPLGHDLFWWTLLLLDVLIHITVIQRILRARRYILDRS